MKALLILLLGAIACQTPSGEGENAETGAPRAEGLRLASVRYELRVDDERAVRDASGKLVLTTDRGYRVTLTHAALSTHSVSLVPCRPTLPGARALLHELFGVPVAHAGHTGRSDPSLVPGLVEDLTVTGKVRELGARTLGETRYCRIHYLVGAGTPDANRPGQERPITGASLALDGVAERAGRTLQLHIETKLAHGALLELAPGAPTGPADGQAAQVRVTRAIGRLLDGLELFDATAQELAKGALSNVISSTRIAFERAR